MVKTVLFGLNIATIFLLPLLLDDVDSFKMWSSYNFVLFMLLSFVNYIINSLLYHLDFGFILSRRPDKLSPIYKIKQCPITQYIEKHELKAVKINYLPHYMMMFPFIGLFKEWKHVKVREVCLNTLSFELDNLAEAFEILAAKEDKEKQKELEEKRLKQEPIDRLNQQFKENYI